MGFDPKSNLGNGGFSGKGFTQKKRKATKEKGGNSDEIDGEEKGFEERKGVFIGQGKQIFTSQLVPSKKIPLGKWILPNGQPMTAVFL